MKQKLEMHITDECIEIKGNTLEIINGLARLVNSLKKAGVAKDKSILNAVNIGLKYKEK